MVVDAEGFEFVGMGAVGREEIVDVEERFPVAELVFAIQPPPTVEMEADGGDVDVAETGQHRVTVVIGPTGFSEAVGLRPQEDVVAFDQIGDVYRPDLTFLDAGDFMAAQFDGGCEVGFCRPRVGDAGLVIAEICPSPPHVREAYGRKVAASSTTDGLTERVESDAGFGGLRTTVNVHQHPLSCQTKACR